MAVLTASTISLLTVGIRTPAWGIALLLCGRGFAIGVVIQPLLTAMIGDLPPDEVPDANTLFNVSERLGGSLGISLLLTFFQRRERVRVQGVIHGLGLKPGSVGGAHGTILPPFARARLADAAVGGFHDTVWLLVLLSLVGVVLAALLHGSSGARRFGERVQST